MGLETIMTSLSRRAKHLRDSKYSYKLVPSLSPFLQMCSYKETGVKEGSGPDGTEMGKGKGVLTDNHKGHINMSSCAKSTKCFEYR